MGRVLKQDADGFMSHPCPYQDDFPSPEDYELTVTERTGGGYMCWAKGKTYLASLVRVPPTEGDTAEETLERMRSRLPRRRELPRRRS